VKRKYNQTAWRIMSGWKRWRRYDILCIGRIYHTTNFTHELIWQSRPSRELLNAPDRQISSPCRGRVRDRLFETRKFVTWSHSMIGVVRVSFGIVGLWFCVIHMSGRILWQAPPTAAAVSAMTRAAAAGPSYGLPWSSAKHPVRGVPFARRSGVPIACWLTHRAAIGDLPRFRIESG